MSPPPPVRLRRDRLTWMLYAQLGVYGYFLYAFNPSVTLLAADLDLSLAVAGLHGTALAGDALVAGSSSAWVSRRWGRQVTLWGGLTLLVAGLVAYVSADLVALTLAASLCAGTGGSTVVNVAMGVLGDHHGPAGPAATAEANAAAAGLGLLGPLALGASSALGLGWRPGLLVTLVLVLALLPARGTPLPRAPRPATTGRTGGRLPVRFWAAWAVLVPCIATEFTLTIWASQLLAERGLSSAAATASVTAVVAGMAVGRLLGSRLALRWAVDDLLLGCFAVTLTGFALFWAVEGTASSLAGLVLAGLGISMQFPLTVARMVAVSGGRTDQAVARSGLGVGLAISVGPFVLGAMADSLGVRTAFLVVPAMQVAAGLVLLLDRTSATDPAAPGVAPSGNAGPAGDARR